MDFELSLQATISNPTRELHISDTFQHACALSFGCALAGTTHSPPRRVCVSELALCDGPIVAMTWG